MNAVVDRAELRTISIRLFEVIPDDLFVLTRAVHRLALEPSGEPLMQLRAQFLGNPSVGLVANQDVDEPEGVVPGELGSVRADELLAHEREHVFAHGRADVRRRQLRHSAEMEEPALDGSAFDHRALVRLEAVDPRGQQRLNRRGNPRRGEVAFNAHRKHLLEEEWVAFRGLEDASVQVVWHIGVREELADERF